MRELMFDPGAGSGVLGRFTASETKTSFDPAPVCSPAGNCFRSGNMVPGGRTLLWTAHSQGSGGSFYAASDAVRAASRHGRGSGEFAQCHAARRAPPKGAVGKRGRGAAALRGNNLLHAPA